MLAARGTIIALGARQKSRLDNETEMFVVDVDFIQPGRFPVTRVELTVTKSPD
jgi:hypothetical protein